MLFEALEISKFKGQPGGFGSYCYQPQADDDTPGQVTALFEYCPQQEAVNIFLKGSL